jgi:aminobenzoyl-glutamate utilization protein B
MGLLLLLPTLLLFAETRDSVRYPIDKLAAAATIDKNAEALTSPPMRSVHAETALKETRSSKALADWAEAKGFRVPRGVVRDAHRVHRGVRQRQAGHRDHGRVRRAARHFPEGAAHQGRAGTGRPRSRLWPNLFGAGSLGGAYAIKELIAAGKLQGTIRFLGTPAEEAVGERSTCCATVSSRTST